MKKSLITKEQTFISRYAYPIEEALSWLTYLSKVFRIKRSKIRSYKLNTEYNADYRCKVEVLFEK